jgi:hypothetical protein
MEFLQIRSLARLAVRLAIGMAASTRKGHRALQRIDLIGGDAGRASRVIDDNGMPRMYGARRLGGVGSARRSWSRTEKTVDRDGSDNGDCHDDNQ